LRREVGANERMKLTRTIKLGPIGARIEIEEPTEPALFDALWPLTVNARIRKRRHRVPEGALTWEIDVFLDRDLVLAEIELGEVSQAVEIPEWLAPFIVREVTQEPAYLNSVMAQRDVAYAEPAMP
jgi:CYTH domain-containing protein